MSVDDQTHESGSSKAYSGDYERSTFEHGVEPYKDPAVLRELYHEDGMSQAEIGRRFSVSQQTISNWMDEFEMETRPSCAQGDRRGIYRSERPDGRAQFVIEDYGGNTEDQIVRFYESNFVALENWLVDALSDEKEVDHVINSPLHINLPFNLVPRDPENHQFCHLNDTAMAVPPSTELLEFVFGDEFDEEEHDYEFVRLLKMITRWNVEIEGSVESNELMGSLGDLVE